MFRYTAVVAGLAAMLWSGPAVAEYLPRPDHIANQGDRETLARLADIVLQTRTSDADPLPELDRLLARLQEPTRTRGLVQFLRAIQMSQNPHLTGAREAAEESLRLLPGYSGPLFLAFDIESYSDRPDMAVSYFLRAADIDPGIAQNIDDYDVHNIVFRLTQRGDGRTLSRFGERLFAIGWHGNIALRSSLAREVIAARMQSGDQEGATAMVPRLAVPSDVRYLQIRNAFRDLWPALARWTGERQQNLWRAYITETRSRWETTRLAPDARAYASALEEAGYDRTLIDEFLPLFHGTIDAEDDADLIFVASIVAGALARAGRWTDIESLFEKALAIWPADQINSINLTANRARYQLNAGNAGAALIGIDATIAVSERFGGQVAAGSLAMMHGVRACALHLLDRDEEAVVSIAAVTEAGTASTTADMYLCLERPDAARGILLQGLTQERHRDNVLSYLQTDDAPPFSSDHGRTMRARREALKADPQLLSAAVAHGRILPLSDRAGAPPEDSVRQEAVAPGLIALQAWHAHPFPLP